jgi:hypothetical protein
LNKKSKTAAAVLGDKLLSVPLLRSMSAAWCGVSMTAPAAASSFPKAASLITTIDLASCKEFNASATRAAASHETPAKSEMISIASHGHVVLGSVAAAAAVDNGAWVIKHGT